MKILPDFTKYQRNLEDIKENLEHSRLNFVGQVIYELNLAQLFAKPSKLYQLYLYLRCAYHYVYY